MSWSRRWRRLRTVLVVLGLAGVWLGPLPAIPTPTGPVLGGPILGPVPGTSAAPRLEVRIDQQAAELTPGGDLAYRVRVRNHTSRDYPNAVIHQLVPPVFAFHSARPAPAASGLGQVRWHLAVPAGEEVVLSVRGTVREAVPQPFWSSIGLGDRPRLATTACVAPKASAAIAGCATTVAEVGPWWLATEVLVGFGVLVGAVVGGYVWTRHRA